MQLCFLHSYQRGIENNRHITNGGLIRFCGRDPRLSGMIQQWNEVKQKF